MSILCWNCRGLGNPRAVRATRDLVRREKPDFLFLIETKQSCGEMEEKKWKIGFNCGIFVGSDGRKGGLALLWQRESKVALLSFSKFHIDVELTNSQGILWRFTGFYGSPYQGEKSDSWNLLKSLKGRSNLPWLCAGDFNEIMRADEKRGKLRRPERQMACFRESADFCNLKELETSGGVFTWSNNRVGTDNIAERLDRALASKEWCDLFPFYTVSILPIHVSDHSPLKVETRQRGIGTAYRHRHFFRFEQAWTRYEECGQIIADKWQSSHNSRSFQSICDNIKASRMALLQWNKIKFGNIPDKLRRLRQELQARRQLAPSQANMEASKQVEKEIEENLINEETKWRQRSRIQWLQEGDRNTAFFHSQASARRRRNWIDKIMDEGGNLVTSQSQMGQIACDFFSHLLSTEGVHGAELALPQPLNGIPDDIKISLQQSFTVDEVKKALFQMNPTKAPGPDGMSPLFYQKYWEVVGTDVTSAVLKFLNEGDVLKKINYTHIALIPKVVDPLHMYQFRPISLCNVLYKIISKTIANRLRAALPFIISDSQSAFVPGRLITDNVLIAYEMIHALKQKRSAKEGVFALKLDMAKAYDRIEWHYVKECMQWIGFNEKWISMVLECITSVSYSILLNGDQHGFFHPTRGLRQGDPISPYIFLLCAEGFSRILSEAENRGDFQSWKVGNEAPNISHLFFADDSLVFAKANIPGARGLKNAISSYEQKSGQKVNLDKSSIMFSPNCDDGLKEGIKFILGVRDESLQETYLGLPSSIGRSKMGAFSGIKDRVWDKVQGWKGRLLSKAGKEILVKSVAQSIPAYSMSCFQIPVSLCNDLNSMTSNFWWGSNESDKKIHWLSWKKLCLPKKEGGLGFRELHTFNMALLSKQAWRIIQFPRSLCARVLRGKYFAHSVLMEAKLGSNPSYSWRSICESRDTLSRGLIWRIGNGNSVRIWKDPWIPVPWSFKICSPISILDENATVNLLILQESKTWNEDLIKAIFLPHEASLILQIPLSIRVCEDRCVWYHSKQGQFSVRSAYHACFHYNSQVLNSMPSSSSGCDSSWWSIIWGLPIPNKIRSFAWRLGHDILPTNQALSRRGINVDLSCTICSHQCESLCHAIRDCPHARATWYLSGINVGNFYSSCDFKLWLDQMRTSLSRDELAMFLVVAWAIWFNRNSLSRGQEAKTPVQTFSFAVTYKEGFTDATAISIPRSPHASCSWTPPSIGRVKINVDAAVFPDENCGGVGCAIRDSLGVFKAGFAKKLPYLTDPSLLETLAIREGLKFAKELGFQFVDLDSDALNVCRQVNYPSESVLSANGHIIEDIVMLQSYFASCKVNYCSRISNSVAHFLAHLARDYENMVSWSEEPPENAKNLLRKDCASFM